jgi:ATP-binding cassette, subfamily B, bacterial
LPPQPTVTTNPAAGFLSVFAYSKRALDLVWTTNRGLSIALVLLTVLAGVLPAGVAYTGALIVDAVVHAAELHRRTGTVALREVFAFVGWKRCWSPHLDWRSAASRSRSRCCARSSASASTS